MKIRILASLCFIVVSCAQPELVEFHGQTMGTTYSIKVSNVTISPLDKSELHAKIDAALDLVNQQMSTYIADSEISLFNKSEQLQPMLVSDGFIKIANLSSAITSESGGAFDATVGPAVELWGFGPKGRRSSPPEDEEIEKLKQFVGMDNIIIENNQVSKRHSNTHLDFSAIAKGYGVDVIADLLYQEGFLNYLVEIGGEVVVKGTNSENKPWRIGIDRPLIETSAKRDFQAILEIRDIAVATSGDYRNYFISDDSVFSHTIDPVTCRPIVNGVASTTILASNCALADAMATAIMVMGDEKGLQWVESKPEVEAMIILRNKDGFRVIMSSGFEKYVSK